MRLAMQMSIFCHFLAIVIGGIVLKMNENGQIVSSTAEKACIFIFFAATSTLFICPIVSIWIASRLPDRRNELAIAILTETLLCAMQVYSILPRVQ